MARVTVEVYGFEGMGGTMKEAREAAQQQAKAAMSGSYAPSVWFLKGNTLIVWREPKHGWGYRILWADHADDGDKLSSCVMMSGTREDIVRSAIAHFADSILDIGESFPEWVDEPTRADIRSRWEWRAKMKAAMAQGLTDEQARRFIAGYFHTIEEARAA